MLIDVLSNGHAKGEATPEQATVTFSTGVTVTVRPLATMTVQLISAAVRKEASPHKPVPPLQKVEAIDGVTTVQNVNDPAYVAALGEWEQGIAAEVGTRFLKVLARRGVEMDIDPAWVAAFRADMEAAGAPIGELDDAEVYLYHYAAATPEDMEKLQRVALRQSQPTEEAVQAHVDSFRGDVSGP